MSKTILAATHNKDKLREFSRILAPFDIEVKPCGDRELLSSIVEDGATFEENALIKARAVFKAFGIPTVADDSGLCVDALGGAPGVYSARYLGEDTSYIEKNNAIIASLNGIAETERTASFRCAIALVTKDGEHVFTGRIDGRIGYEARGENGFGYDPIFYVGERTTAEMSSEEKDAISHRGRALRALCDHINDLI